MKKRIHGSTMLEVLVSIVVVSFGLLGLAGLQAVGMQYTNSAALRTIATQQAYDMADRLRANQAGVIAGYYNNPTAAETASCLQNAGCTPQQLAQMDVFLWQQELSRLLPGAAPGGEGIVCIDNTPDDGTPAAPACDNVAGAPYVIKVWWDDKSDVAVAQRFVTSFQP